MDTPINIKFNVTPAQKETIYSRMSENGFDEISAYLKVVALRTQAFSLTTTDSSTQVASVELDFTITQSQQMTIEKKMKESGCDELTTYLQYVAMHGVVTAVVEIRSTGNLDSILERLAASRKR